MLLYANISSRKRSAYNMLNCKFLADKAVISTVMVDKKKKGFVNKESTICRTYQIQSEISKHFSLEEKLRYYIKTSNYPKFKESFSKDLISIEKIDKDGYTFLNLAVKCNVSSIAKLLIDEGADVNTQDNLHNTPLHWALSCQNYEVVDLLRSKKADEELVNSNGLNAWQHAHETLKQTLIY